MLTWSVVSGGLNFSDWEHQWVSTYCLRITDANCKETQQDGHAHNYADNKWQNKQTKNKTLRLHVCSSCKSISAHLTDGESSLGINCEFCKMDAKLYNINISGRKKDKNKMSEKQTIWQLSYNIRLWLWPIAIALKMFICQQKGCCFYILCLL